MRTLLAIALFVGGISGWNAGAYAARKSVRSANAPFSAAQLRDSRRGDPVCERRARADDPGGTFAGYPRWARSAFGQGRR